MKFFLLCLLSLSYIDADPFPVTVTRHNDTLTFSVPEGHYEGVVVYCNGVEFTPVSTSENTWTLVCPYNEGVFEAARCDEDSCELVGQTWKVDRPFSYSGLVVLGLIALLLLGLWYVDRRNK